MPWTVPMSPGANRIAARPDLVDLGDTGAGEGAHFIVRGLRHEGSLRGGCRAANVSTAPTPGPGADVHI